MARNPNEDNELCIAEIPYETGQIHYRYSRKMSQDGTRWIRDGLFVEYHPNGSVSSEGMYEEGLETGIWKDYHENGVLAAEGAYREGREVGVWRFYDEQGELEEELDYDAKEDDEPKDEDEKSGKSGKKHYLWGLITRKLKK